MGYLTDPLDSGFLTKHENDICHCTRNMCAVQPDLLLDRVAHTCYGFFDPYVLFENLAVVVTTVALFGSGVVCILWSPFGFSSEGYEYMHWRCDHDYICRAEGYDRSCLRCGRCYIPALLGHSLGSSLHLEPSPLRPGGRQPYSGAPSGGGGCRPFSPL